MLSNTSYIKSWKLFVTPSILQSMSWVVRKNLYCYCNRRRDVSIHMGRDLFTSTTLTSWGHDCRVGHCVVCETLCSWVLESQCKQSIDEVEIQNSACQVDLKDEVDVDVNITNWGDLEHMLMPRHECWANIIAQRLFRWYLQHLGSRPTTLYTIVSLDWRKHFMDTDTNRSSLRTIFEMLWENYLSKTRPKSPSNLQPRSGKFACRARPIRQ